MNRFSAVIVAWLNVWNISSTGIGINMSARGWCEDTLLYQNVPLFLPL